MLLGALVDAGAPLEVLQATVDRVMPDTVRLLATEVRRGGMRATKVDVIVLRDQLPHRSWADIRGSLAQAEIADAVRSRALAVFHRLASAESRAHGTPVEDVHFHEVGAWDSIADVVGVCAAVEALGIVRLSAGPVALGSGGVQTEHGHIPVPCPRFSNWPTAGPSVPVGLVSWPRPLAWRWSPRWPRRARTSHP